MEWVRRTNKIRAEMYMKTSQQGEEKWKKEKDEDKEEKYEDKEEKYT